MAAPQTRSETARAKINLTLHVGPVRPDGFHPIQSLVVFADVGDVLDIGRARPDTGPTLTIGGPFGHHLSAEPDNLVLRAASLIGDQLSPFDFHLVKNLPIASGIGGGSADAAAAIRGICADHNLSSDDYWTELAALGADIPVCIRSETCLMRGKGEQIMPLPGLGRLHAVLVNPGVSVSTGSVFKVFDKMPAARNWDEVINTGTLLEMSMFGRNDLQPAAIESAPVIETVLQELTAQNQCRIARMSGSGATCFGLFPDRKTADRAAQSLKGAHPDWWCVATMLGDVI